MNYYELENHMFERHHAMVRKAEARRLKTVEREGIVSVTPPESSARFFTAIGTALRMRVLPGRSSAI